MQARRASAEPLGHRSPRAPAPDPSGGTRGGRHNAAPCAPPPPSLLPHRPGRVEELLHRLAMGVGYR